MDKKLLKYFKKPLTKKIMTEMNQLFAHYIFYKRENKGSYAGYECWCSRCNKHYTASFKTICPDLHTAKHGYVVECPKCKHKGELKHINIGHKKCLSETRKVVVWQRIDFNRIVARAFYCFKVYNGNPDNIKMLDYMYKKDDFEPFPQTRYYFERNGDVQVDKLLYGYYRKSCSWSSTNVIEPFTKHMGINEPYFFVNEQDFNNSFLKYAQLSTYYDYAEKKLNYYSYMDVWPMKYLAWYTKYPCSEMLLKLGLGDFVSEAILYKKPHKRFINWSGKTPLEVFKNITKQEFNELRANDIDVHLYIDYMSFKKAGKKITFSELTDIYKEYSYKSDKFLKIVRSFDLTVTQAKNYINKQLAKQKKRSLVVSEILTNWHDYIDDSKFIGYDLTHQQVLMPKNIISAHAQSIKIRNALTTEIKEKNMKKLTSKLIEKYSFEYGDYVVVVPRSMQDIIVEGKILEHCVGSYAERHASGKLIILFMRAKNDIETPLYTIELSETKKGNEHSTRLVQHHGYKNEIDGDRKIEKPQEVLGWIKEFEEFIKNPQAYRNAQKKTKKQQSTAA